MAKEVFTESNEAAGSDTSAVTEAAQDAAKLNEVMGLRSGGQGAVREGEEGEDKETYTGSSSGEEI